MLTGKAKKSVREIAVLGCFVFAFSCAVEAAIPTAEECKAVRAKLAELTSDDYKALKAKTKTNEQVGDALAQYADNEESAAGKFALLQDAFQQYVVGKNADKAKCVYDKAQTVGGVEYALEMARPSRSKLSAYATSKNPQAKALKERIVEDEKSFQRVGIVKAKLKKAPGDESLCEQLGIEYAAIGDWESALAAFVTAAGEVAKVADWELNGGKGIDYTAATVGAFWWKFADNFPKRKNVEEALKLHAAMWYKLALDKDAFKGNEKTIIEKRIAETEKFGAAEQAAEELGKRQMQGLSPITLELAKDNKIDFIACPAGEFLMGDAALEATMACVKSHRVKITRPFWVSKYKVTKKQWNTYHKVSLSEYDEKMGGMQTPECEDVSYDEAIKFCEYLTKRFRSRAPKGYVIRLLTEAEWEWAVKVNDQKKEDLYNNPDSHLAQIAVLEQDVRKLAAERKVDISSLKRYHLQPIEVGTKKPNGLGLYDMLGNGAELMLDVIDVGKLVKMNRPLFEDMQQTAIVYQALETDPLRYTAYGSALKRGLAYNNMEPSLYCKNIVPVGIVSGGVGRSCIRLCIGPDLMKEKGYTAKAKKR